MMHMVQNSAGGRPPEYTPDIQREVDTFFELSRALPLEPNEEQALLSISARDLVRLKTDHQAALDIGGTKLLRRLSYAIPILRRMVESNDA